MNNRLLIIDDEAAICSSLEFALEDEYIVYAANSAETAMALIMQEEFDLMLLDLKLGSSSGLELLPKIKSIRPNVSVIMMTAYGSIQSSVEAMKLGAFYYITKPINIDELLALLSNAVEYQKLKSRVEYLNGKLVNEYELSGIIAKSGSMKKVFDLIEKVKDTDTNVMITGESGTGKELVARAVHFTGNRKGEPFEVINCAAINPNLLESELFGHEKGAFTGALTKKKGIFELAEKGTLFLDEISEMDINLQAKLLRAVQEKEITPVGSQNRKKIDVRIICATNKDLKEEVLNGRFREDLYFRLNVINIHLPPLRERREDIPLLIHYFIEKYNRKMGKSIRALSEEAAELLYSYDYKGNVRELQNIIERSIVLTDGEIINSSDLPSEVYLESSKSIDTLKNGMLIPVFVGEDMGAIEKKVILHTLKYNKGSKKLTAEMLKISERNLRYKLKEYEN